MNTTFIRTITIAVLATSLSAFAQISHKRDDAASTSNPTQQFASNAMGTEPMESGASADLQQVQKQVQLLQKQVQLLQKQVQQLEVKDKMNREEKQNADQEEKKIREQEKQWENALQGIYGG
jgi:peptidoglycan hydrolase CwlO-like protein